MKTLISFILLIVSSVSFANSYCENDKEVDPEFPAGITGTYEIVGRLPNSNNAFSGALSIDINKDSTAYILKRTVAGETIIGKAWIKRCSPDKFVVFSFEYKTVPAVYSGNCYLRFNGDNYYLISCYTWNEKDKEKETQHGLEAMFQNQ